MPLACALCKEFEGLLKTSLELLWLTISNGIPVFRDSFRRLIGVIEINTIRLNDLSDRIATAPAANMVRVERVLRTKYNTAGVTVSGVIRSKAFSGMSPSVIRVPAVGANAFILTLFLAPSCASVFIIPITPIFAEP